jgi:uncharacterized membrane protein (UPF0127 family)
MTLSYRLIRVDDGRVILEELELATTFWTRFKGLQFRRQLTGDQGLLLAPCPSLHTCFMRFPIDAFMLDCEGRVLAIRRDVRPWRALIGVPKTKVMIETSPSSIDIKVGEQLKWEPRRSVD